MKHKKITNHDNPSRKLMPGCVPVIRAAMSRLYDEPATQGRNWESAYEASQKEPIARQARIWQGKGCAA